jgi:uncharacterized protein with NRDE domain
MHPKYKLILAANRDEFYERPTAQAQFWKDDPDILGGRDLKAGGSWMTLSKKGKFAAVTNYRDLKNIREDATSRGEIPTNFLKNDQSPHKYLQSLHERAENYNGFNVLAGTTKQLMHYSNYERKLNVIKPGIHGLSNALLNTPWPKVEEAKKSFEQITRAEFDHEELLQMMGNTEVAEDPVLPDTGVSKELERALSAMCIRTENYGTCCSTVITIDRFGKVNFTEKSYPVGNRKESTTQFTIQVDENSSY